MTVPSIRRIALPLLLGLAVPFAHAADPESILARMYQAARTLDYEGVFVYRHDEHLDSLRILHKTGHGGARERLVSLNGEPREIIRTEREVRCYLPDENAVLVEHRRADRRDFPGLLPESASVFGKNYLLHPGKSGRVAGRKTQSLLIKPQDAYRYGYRLWVDEATGLLLKANLVDAAGRIVEQYMFTQIAIGKPISEADLQPQYPAKDRIMQGVEENPSLPVAGQWEAAGLPAGFALSAHIMRTLPQHQQPVEHLVFSDGLAVVSVFIETAEEPTKSSVLHGHTQMGAVHAYGMVVDGYQITVVGEVPAATVALIGDSVTRHKEKK
jgi:sigma-E factor negative regulatory protein RseB